MSTCQQVGGECAWGCPSTTPVGTELISTLPHLTLRWEDIFGLSGKAQETVVVRRYNVVKRASQLTPGLANMTKFPLGVHFAAESQMLAWMWLDANVLLHTSISAGARIETALALSIVESI